ncbi:hypothetical protein [Marinobacter sp. MIT932201]|uniref:hypothetical protein n=1 Tax=Marinobacter sp. MIT932201 TaxID=3096995 RepID=UPI00399B3791
MPKQNFTIDVPQIACITVTGPIQCGKSIVIDRIKKMLEQEFGATVVSKDWKEETTLSNYESLEDWQRKMVAGTIWNVSEPVKPVPITFQADQCTYPECHCPFDMGPDHQCLKGLPVIRK